MNRKLGILAILLLGSLTGFGCASSGDDSKPPPAPPGKPLPPGNHLGDLKRPGESDAKQGH